MFFFYTSPTTPGAGACNAVAAMTAVCRRTAAADFFGERALPTFLVFEGRSSAAAALHIVLIIFCLEKIS